MSDVFTFRHFTVRQEHCAMKVGTDGVLLGSWAEAEGASRILDIGTGTGLLALMMAQRFPYADVDAVEIDHEAACQAKENVSASPSADRINIIETSVQTYSSEYRGESYDAIVSNPPYFNSSLKNPDSKRTLARHTDSLPYRELFRSASKLIAEEGVFSVVMPTDCEGELQAEASIAGFFLTRKTLVRTTECKQPKRCLLAFRKKRVGATACEDHTMMSADGKPTDWYARLTRDFYLEKK